MNQKTEELPGLIPLDKLIDDLEFKLQVEHMAGTKSVDQMKKIASVLVYLKRYRASLEMETKEKKE